jgi:hypothetical protein
MVLFFAANWSEECQLMTNVIGELSKDETFRNLVRFLEIEAEDNEDLSIKYGIEAVPSFIFLRVFEFKNIFCIKTKNLN